MALTLIQMQAQYPDPLRQGVVDMLRESSRVMDRLHFISHPGLDYRYNKRSALPGVAFRGLNEDYTATAGVVSPAVESLAILGGKIKTDHVAISLKGDQARSNEIAAQMEAAGKFFDKQFFNGDTSTSVKGFDGLKARLTGDQLVTQATNGATPTWEKVIELQDQVEGPNSEKTLFMNQTTRRNLVNDILAETKDSVKAMLEMRSGVYYFNGSEIVEVFYDETETAILAFDETCGSSSVCSSMYCVRFGGAVDERYVQGIAGMNANIEHRGPIEYGTYVEDVIEMVGGVGIFSGYGAARLQGLKAS